MESMNILIKCRVELFFSIEIQAEVYLFVVSFYVHRQFINV